MLVALRRRNLWEKLNSFARLGSLITLAEPSGVPHPSRPGGPALSEELSLVLGSPSKALSARGEATSGGTKGGDTTFHGRFTQNIKGLTIQLSVTGRKGRSFEIKKRAHPTVDALLDGPDSQDLNALQYTIKRVHRAFQSTFLPAGYPQSVGPNYVRFTVWQGVSSVAITANSVLASTFLLYSVGLGAGAIPTASALNWVLKDGIGQLGTLLFGKTIAHNFDIHSKSWYMLSMIMINLAIGVEMLTILCPAYFLFMGSFANSVKGLAIMASGSTRSVFNLSFVRDNNIADITAKGTSQYIFASLIGTAVGAGLASYIKQDFGLAFLALNVLGFSTMLAGYYTVKSIPLPTLNNTRLQLIGEAFLKNLSIATSEQRRALALEALREGQPPATDDWRKEVPYQQHDYDRVYDESVDATIPTPLELASEDPPLPWLMGDRRMLNPAIRVGYSMDKLVQGNAALLVMLVNTFKYTNYMVLPCESAIHVILHHKAKGVDIIQAFLQACVLRKWLCSGGSVTHERLHELRIVLQDTLLVAQRLTPPFMETLEEHGWTLQKILVEGERRRASW